jgi:GntR family transcriptional regulator
VPPDRFAPLHERLKRAVSEEILMGRWPPGSVLPGEVALARQYGVAVGTVRRALADLVAEGLLVRRPRIGTVVTGRTPEHSLRFFFQYFRLHGADGSLKRSRAVPLALTESPAGVEDAQRLGIGAGEALLRLFRLRVVDGLPVMTDLYRVAAARLAGFPRSLEAVPELLFRHLLETYGIRIAAVREELRAEPATAEDRRLLGLPDPAAVLVIEATAFDQAGCPVLLATQRASTAAHRYVNEVR